MKPFEFGTKVTWNDARQHDRGPLKAVVVSATYYQDWQYNVSVLDEKFKMLRGERGAEFWSFTPGRSVSHSELTEGWPE